MRLQKSAQVALGGVSTAVCLLLMLLTSLFPFTEFAFPAMAGVVLIAVVIENGTSAAVLVYAAVSLLSIFTIPSKVSAAAFTVFFGYYPILKAYLEKIRLRVLEYLAKFFVFNFSMAGSYWVLIVLLGLGEMMEDTGMFGKYSLLVLAVLGNVMFFVYDIAVSRVIFAYTNWLRPKIFRKLFH